MKASRIQSILIHIAATMLLSFGFVKTADKIDPMEAVFSNSESVNPHKLDIATLPCSTGKR